MAEPVGINAFSEHGQGNQEDNVFLGEKDLIGTIFFRPGNTLAEANFFNLDSSVSKAYQNVTFPLKKASAYDARVLLASHNFSFDLSGTNAALEQAVLMEFEKSTRIIMDQDTRTGVLEVSLADLLPYTWVTTASAAGVQGFTQVSKAFSSFAVTQILQLGFAQDVTFRMVPPSGLTFQAYAAAVTPFLPGAGLAVDGSTPANRGFSITLRIKSIEQVRKT